MAERTDVDVVVVGGGLVGMALSLSLARAGLSSLLLESNEAPSDSQTAEHFDDRTLVINPAAQQFWQDLGLWPEIKALTTAIKTVHVSNQGRFGVVRFNHQELQVPQLGHVVAAKSLAQVLFSQVEKHELITCLQPAQLLTFEQFDDHVKVVIDQQGVSSEVSAPLMVAADGVQSGIRTKLRLATEVKSYQRTAIVANLSTSQKHGHRAFERLTTEGPMALLPFKNRFGFVWSMHADKAADMLAMSDQQFLSAAQQHFGYRAGGFQRLGRRSSYPIYQIKVPTQHAHRVVLMGNAAHAVSPVSAQGLNLAVRGIDRLSRLLAAQQGQDIGHNSVLKAYQDASEADQQRTLNYTDDLMTWFKIDEPVVNTLRSAALVAINSSLTLKQALFKTAGGLR